MCRHPKSKKNAKKEYQGKPRKKQTCWQKCRRRICLWCCRRLRRCLKRIIFGDPNPRLAEFEVAGIDLDNVKNPFKNKSSQTSLEKKTEKKSSVITLFRNYNKSTKSISMKDTLPNEGDKYSIAKNKRNKIKSIISDFKERSLLLGLSKDSLLKLNASKKRFGSLAEKFDNKDNLAQKHINLFGSIEQLKRKFSLTASKTVLTKNMLDDYKAGKISFSKMPNASKLNFDTLDKKDFNNILAHYESQKKNNRSVDKKKVYSFVKQSRLKQFKSDMRAKFL